MTLLRNLLITLLLPALWVACQPSQPVGEDLLAKVGERELRRTEVLAIIPKGSTSADSLLYAENYIKRWIKDALLYEVALENLGSEKAEIDRLAEEYRQSLIRYRYQERLVRERLQDDIRESDKLNYYDENQKKFVLDKSLIKGLFLKVPADAPGLDEIKKSYKSTTEEALEKIEKYSLQNATIYDYFLDRWVDFDELMDNIPMHIADPKQFLKSNKQIELTDSLYCYMLNINEYLSAGMVAPYDYAAPSITEMLINRRKVEFLRTFEEELYNDAIRKGKIGIYSEAD
ncbi:peptidyl-prolyl cis-trans isomerase [Parabacteroides sp. OttesenSCG-928-N08]|nr:peptidyl-prolyl cis-trans isomerase [Parabacteroides sp. OttesenSCG-928-N08]